MKVLDELGTGSFADIGYGIRYAADRGADVINLGLGAYPGVEAVELAGIVTDARDAIVHARQQGAVMVVAAGNEAFPLCASPSFNDGALCVVATDNRELRSAYSNDAIKPDLKALAAPGGSAAPFCGEDVLSTVPAGEGTDASRDCSRASAARTPRSRSCSWRPPATPYEEEGEDGDGDTGEEDDERPGKRPSGGSLQVR